MSTIMTNTADIETDEDREHPENCGCDNCREAAYEAWLQEASNEDIARDAWLNGPGY